MTKQDDTQQDIVEEKEETTVSEETKGAKESNELETQTKEWEEKYKRALADYQNLQKRVNEEKKEWLQFANRDLLLRLLPILDTLMLASKHSEDKSLQISINLFQDGLKSEGVQKIDVAGKMFDPNIMEAIVTEDGEEGKVIEEIRVGYMLHDKLLRPAQVKVGKKTENDKKN